MGKQADVVWRSKAPSGSKHELSDQVISWLILLVVALAMVAGALIDYEP